MSSLSASEQRQLLGHVLLDGQRLADAIGAEQERRDLAALRDRVRDELMRVVVVGKFSTGKSTLVNALLGADVLPRNDVPTTAVEVRVGWGSEPSVAMAPRRHDGKASSLVAMSLDDFREHVWIVDGVHPYDHAEMQWPCDLLRGGVQVVDTPGRDDAAERDDALEHMVAAADAVIFVSNATSALPQSEREFVRHVLTHMRHRETFFVFNRFDLVRDSAMVKAYCAGMVVELARELDPPPMVDGRVFFTDAVSALDARMGGQPTSAHSAGVEALERALSALVQGELREAKTGRELDYAGALLDRVEGVLAAQLAEIQAKIGATERDLAREHAALDRVELEGRELKRVTAGWLDAAVADAGSAGRRFFAQMGSASKSWPDAIRSVRYLDAFDFRASAQLLADELVDALTERLKDRYRQWLHERFFDSFRARAAASLRDALAQATRDSELPPVTGIDDIEGAEMSISMPVLDRAALRRLPGGLSWLDYITGRDAEERFLRRVVAEGFSEHLSETVATRVGELMADVRTSLAPVQAQIGRRVDAARKQAKRTACDRIAAVEQTLARQHADATTVHVRLGEVERLRERVATTTPQPGRTQTRGRARRS